jgi:hypothetical protein
MAIEDINEPIEILASFKRTTRGTAVAKPEIMNWRGRRYQIDQLGLRYPTTKGRRTMHRFTFAHDNTMFELEFDSEQLTWQLLRLSDGNTL